MNVECGARKRVCTRKSQCVAVLGLPAMAEFALWSAGAPGESALSTLGTLHSLVPATPNTSGDSFLHHIYKNIHNETLDNFDNIQYFYHSGLDVGALAEADFSWWEKALKSGLRE
jgi:hypothetical protein